MKMSRNVIRQAQEMAKMRGVSQEDFNKVYWQEVERLLAPRQKQAAQRSRAYSAQHTTPKKRR